MARNRLSPFCEVFRGMDVDPIPHSKLGERVVNPILDDEVSQVFRERASTMRTAKSGKLRAAELSRQPCSAFELFDAKPRRIENRSTLGSTRFPKQMSYIV